MLRILKIPALYAIGPSTYKWCTCSCNTPIIPQLYYWIGGIQLKTYILWNHWATHLIWIALIFHCVLHNIIKQIKFQEIQIKLWNTKEQRKPYCVISVFSNLWRSRGIVLNFFLNFICLFLNVFLCLLLFTVSPLT